MKNDKILVTSSEPLTVKSQSDEDSSNLGLKLRRVVDMSSINAQKKSTVSYPPAPAQNNKKQQKSKDHKDAKRTSAKHSKVSAKVKKAPSEASAPRSSSGSVPKAQRYSSDGQAKVSKHTSAPQPHTPRNSSDNQHKITRQSTDNNPRASQKSSDSHTHSANFSNDTQLRIAKYKSNTQPRIARNSSDAQPHVQHTSDVNNAALRKTSDALPKAQHNSSDFFPQTPSVSSDFRPKVARPSNEFLSIDAPISVPAVAVEPQMMDHYAEAFQKTDPSSQTNKRQSFKKGGFKTHAQFNKKASARFQKANRANKKYVRPMSENEKDLQAFVEAPTPADPLTAVPANNAFVPAVPAKMASSSFRKPSGQFGKRSGFKHKQVSRSPQSAINRAVKLSGSRKGVKLSGAHKTLKRAHMVFSHREALRNQSPTEDIIARLLLQSWQAKLWIDCIINVAPKCVTSLISAIPLVQAKLVSNINVQDGEISADIIHAHVTFKLHQFTPGQWRTVISMLSERALFSTALLNGELPEGIIEIFKQGSVSLFPQKIREFSTTCDTCELDLCEHICTVLLTIAQKLEEDPFFLLQLRGISREDLLQQLRNARSTQVVDTKSKYGTNYELPAGNIDFTKFYTPKSDLSDFDVTIKVTDSTLIKRLGNPTVWGAPITAEGAFVPIIRLTALVADEIGLMPPLEDDDVIDPSAEFETAIVRSSAMLPRVTRLPNTAFLKDEIPEEILKEMPRDPQSAGEDLLNWLQTLGATDIRTLARRVRLKKTEVKFIINAFLEHELIRQEGEGDKAKFVMIST